MKTNTIRLRSFYLFLLLAISTCPAFAQEQNEGETIPVGTMTWNEYGLSFELPDEARFIVDNDVNTQIRTQDMDIDIYLIDRRQYTDEQLGQEVIASAKRGELDLKTAHGLKIDNGQLQGGALYGLQSDGNAVIIAAIENINTLYAFIIIIQNLEGKGEKGHNLLNSIMLVPPENLIVRK